MQERRINPVRRARFEEAWNELRTRLELLCSHMTVEEFHQLTARMTRLYLKYETGSSLPTFN